MIDNDDLLVQDRDGVLYVTLNRPERRNALSASVVDGMERAISHVLDNPEKIRAVVLRGAGGIFCAGGDLKDFKSVFQEGGAERSAVSASNRRGGALFTALDRLPVVVVAAVEKAAMGGGVGLAAVADVTIATADTKFSLTETTLGIPPAQISPFIVARVGSHNARALMLTAARIDAAEAFRIGMVDKVVADSAAMDVAVDELVTSVRRCAPGANAVSKELVHAASTTPHDELLDRAAGSFADALLGDEAREGVRAFLSKDTAPWAQ